ncbi:aminodeoxychorismate/anthranilate synthase component II [bacterium]|nr:aminodeoxychorismate/anthranilate synthase component II [bacterium]
MIAVIDNYDSFVYNLVQYLGELGEDVTVFRNDEINVHELSEMQPKGILLSPGPCTPNEAGICLTLVTELCGKIPIFGVCLGHQAIASAFGAIVVRADRVVHGKTSMIYHDGAGIYSGIENPFRATRYHSLLVDPDSVPDCLIVSSRTEDGLIMGLRHREFPIEGVQYHPESILTEHGHRLLENFLTQTC